MHQLGIKCGVCTTRPKKFLNNRGSQNLNLKTNRKSAPLILC